MDHWTPSPFTEDELAGIDPVIRAYMKDVDRTLLLTNLRLSVSERLLKGEAYAKAAVKLRNQARKDKG